MVWKLKAHEDNFFGVIICVCVGGGGGCKDCKEGFLIQHKEEKVMLICTSEFG